MGKKANTKPESGPEHPKDVSYVESVTEKRKSLFETLKAEQIAHRKTISGDPIKITLPDGTVKEGKKHASTPFDIAKEISKSLAAKSLIAKVDGALWDMSRPLEGSCELRFYSFDDNEGRDTFWHSSAHILGQAIEMKYGCKLCIGPCTTRGEGFYYDGFYGELGLNEDHFKGIDSRALEAVAEKQPFERIEVTRDQALDMFSDNKFKVEIIEDLPEDKTITVYRCGPLVDLCRGPHIPNTSFVKAFACLKASSVYWRGDKDRESLQRVYGISFPDQKLLKNHKDMLEEAKKYDHRVLGKNQELFFFHPLSPGCCIFLPHGCRIYNRLMEFIRNEYWKRGYQEVITPNMYNMQLWETSGHAANYRENMFLLEIDKQEFGLKPMNCPGHCLIFAHKVRSYRELPLRLADFGVLHRNEASGALTGLTRVRRFQQDDAHIFCRESQIKDEVRQALDFINYTYEVFGFTYELKLSTRPENYLGDLETWDKAEAALTEALNESGKPWEINEADGAFYGPKIDISVSDALKRKFQCATLQLDFQLPSRFNLSYSAEDEAKKERPVMIHRAILGSVERMFAILLEHYKGKWPFWLSPRQAIVLPVSVKAESYALQLKDQIHEAGFYVDVDTSDRKIGKKVFEAQMAQYNYILVVGEEEVKSGQVSVRVRDKEGYSVQSIEELLKSFKEASSAYWRGDKDRESLQRVYGISFPYQNMLKDYNKKLEEAKVYDHRELGKNQELFFFHPHSPGSSIFLPHGDRIYIRLMKFITNEYSKRGYQEVITPNMYNMQLWETSGHAANYRENMFSLEVDKQEFGLKPMNCPGHCLIFDHRVRSYRELPLRLADFGVLHRNEASGALTGLTCVRRFQQDDAHIFCRESQIKDEVRQVLDFINYTYAVFGLTYELKLSTRPENYLGDPETWDKAEAALTEALNESGKPWKINEADGAFYGPKIDISVSDALKRKFQCATLQLDFQLPSRFNLSYSAEDEAKKERPVMIHRAILGSFEHMLAILLEHYQGKWPFWLSPRQAIVCPVFPMSEKLESYALQLIGQIHEAGFYVDIDMSDRELHEKVREAQMAQYNYILVVGEEEVKSGQVNVRVQDKEDYSIQSTEELLKFFKEEAAAFR